jgi:hypothetical protein
MNTSSGIRRFHRWLSLVFTVAAIANIMAVIRGSPAQWLGLLAVVPLIPLMLTGLYMFIRPYVTRTRPIEERQIA